MKIKVINGPNLNMLGIREPQHYGNVSYNSLIKLIEDYCKENNIEVKCVQSNHEGILIDEIHDCYNKFDGIVINPGAYTHTSIAILDAVKSVDIPAVEVHISDLSKREAFRQISYIREACVKTITGHGINGYIEAIEFLKDR
mgnify:CR=1 FL=1